MEINAIADQILKMDGLLTRKEKRLFHFYSMKNFVFHFEEIKVQRIKEKILRLLSEYVDELAAIDYDYKLISTFHLARTYLDPLAEYYVEYAHFIRRFKLGWLIIWSVLGDGILYWTGMLHKALNFPIITICLTLYYLYVRIFKESRGRVFGFEY